MPMFDVYGERRESEIMNDTWGHLAPSPDKAYSGYALFTVGCFGDLAVIRYDFAGLDDSPWFYEDLHRWIWDQDPQKGEVYRFDGTYCRDRGVRFDGSTRRLNLKDA